jgi:hypothetical protein
MIILILSIEFSVFVLFLFFIYRLVKKDIKKYRQKEPLPLHSNWQE